jgi:hypothetical protein
MKYDTYGLVNGKKKKKSNNSNTTCTKKFWKTNLEKDLLNIKCISNTIKYKKLKIIPNSMVRRMFNPI